MLFYPFPLQRPVQKTCGLWQKLGNAKRWSEKAVRSNINHTNQNQRRDQDDNYEIISRWFPWCQYAPKYGTVNKEWYNLDCFKSHKNLRHIVSGFITYVPKHWKQNELEVIRRVLNKPKQAIYINIIRIANVADSLPRTNFFAVACLTSVCTIQFPIWPNENVLSSAMLLLSQHLVLYRSPPTVLYEEFRKEYMWCNKIF